MFGYLTRVGEHHRGELGTRNATFSISYLREDGLPSFPGSSRRVGRFIESVERHILRNYIFLHAIEQGLPIPIGTQDAGVLNTSINDEDVDAPGLAAGTLDDEMDNGNAGKTVDVGSLSTEAEFKRRAAEAYTEYASQYKVRFKWLRPNLFNKNLARDLKADVQALFKILQVSSKWDAGKDAKLRSLIELLAIKHPDEKVLVFTQYADTVHYLETQLKAHGIDHRGGDRGGEAAHA